MTDHSSLIARLESADGPCRELDAAIFAFLGKAPETGGYYGWEQTSPGHWSQPTDSEGRHFNVIFAPLFTSNVDDAHTLVPKHSDGNHYCTLLEMYANGKGNACVITPDDKLWSKEQSTPAIALCIAALRSLQTTQGGEDKGEG